MGGWGELGGGGGDWGAGGGLVNGLHLFFYLVGKA